MLLISLKRVGGFLPCALLRLVVSFFHWQVSSGDQLAAIEEMKGLASSFKPVSHGSSGLDPRLLKSLQASVQSFCESIVEDSFSDFQVALFGDEQQIQYSLKEAGVSRYTLKQLKTCWPNTTSFAVALSSREDLQKIVALQSTYKPFQRMGVRLPSISWVSKFSQKAVDTWKDHVRKSCKESDVIEYKESFGQEVASRYEAGNNYFSAAGERVELRVRFSLVLFPISFLASQEMSDMLQKALPDVQLDLDSLMLLEHKGGERSIGGKIAIVSGDAFNEIHVALKHPKKLTLQRDEHYFNVLAVTMNDWVYTFGNLHALDNQWEAVADSIIALIHKAEENELQELAIQELDSDETLRYFEQQLVDAAKQRLQNMQSKRRLELLGRTFLGERDEDQMNFVTRAMESDKSDKSMVSLLYQLGGRRYVPDFLLDIVLADSPDAEPLRQKVQRLCQFFGQLHECKIPKDVAQNFEYHAKGAEVVAHREVNGYYFFLLRDAENIMQQLLRSVPTGCELVQQLPVFLRTTSLTVTDAFRRLDEFRALGVCIKEIEQVNDYVEVQITTWHEKFSILPLRDFQVRHMKLVRKSANAYEHGKHDAFPVSLREWAFYAHSFEQEHVEIPSTLQRHAVPLDPAEFDPPPTLPAGDELPLLRVSFSHLSSASWLMCVL
eukprot:s3071_g4.t1